MLREIVEGASWADDSELMFSEIRELIEKINRKIGSADADVRVYRSLEVARDSLEKALKRL